MKKLCLILCCLCAVLFTASAQIVKSGWTSTNSRPVAADALMHWASNGLSAGTIFVDALAGDDTTGTGAPTAPYATMTKGQTVATNGQTVAVIRGNFAETGLGKSGVDWFIGSGVMLNGGGVGVWDIGTNNGVSELKVFGQGNYTNTVMRFNNCTNCFALVNGQTYFGLTGGGIAYFYNGNSNTFTGVFMETRASDPLFGAAGHADGTPYTNSAGANLIFRANLSATKIITYTKPHGNSNDVVWLSAPNYLQSAKSSTALAGSYATTIFNGGSFSRNGQTVTTVSQNMIFNGVTIVNTNQDTGSTGLGQIRGTIYQQ